MAFILSEVIALQIKRSQLALLTLGMVLSVDYDALELVLISVELSHAEVATNIDAKLRNHCVVGEAQNFKAPHTMHRFHYLIAILKSVARKI